MGTGAGPAVCPPSADEPEGRSRVAALPAPSAGNVLHDQHRIASARRLLVEVPGPAAFDRLSALAARLVGAGHAKVTLFTDQDTVIGGGGPPPRPPPGPAPPPPRPARRPPPPAPPPG